jgi:adenosylmethionine-8-amino-7-oxononanoate aminotransferase
MIYPTTNPAMSETMVVARAEGPYIYDKQGKRYLEGMAGLWCTALGYGNEEIIEACATPDARAELQPHVWRQDPPVCH